ncbi:glycerol-3-phosphate 1-O-acyltransferase PlsY [Acidomonas methanolica]|uniref:Glycerol-3-phosphate acyltransferase n=1 Tax=Acidomonas methanolica NBRC 104435 TaxID=1231351 RepID=A0A023D2Q3_ACIMT|nr:glycerol-3-phosphate 1-O-acyltransferase PlsY [Acidomonas methanolica]MBU2654794.1 glycerol-3-phosphate 1-O-acyltransferase PlsY [Acidomonas methanolica]TCS26459.1 glycerol-3-phosphate acyltransferase PlsY [Acidomonas methanolica]GAJ28438.1 hypothetical protein Amme_023_031 [Acidomonas methanolica NBRC 104435]GBQ51164.1 hypothetical protein AA0498_1401 [Acidomonas methanolica]GEK99207.1 glycerol-3-phosphate acyltransferase [Acidomonas methanolica NBRC 104435]
MSVPHHVPPALLLAAALAYLLGSIPFGLFLTRLGGAGDIRTIGSGNIGATNVLRTGRRGLAAATLVLDALKGVAAVLIARRLCPGDATMAASVAALLAVIGHCFPIWLGFRGGKGVATGLGVIGALCWPVGLICCAIWLAVAKLTHISSAGALAAFLAAPMLMPVLSAQPFRSPLCIATLLLTLLILLRHRENIERLIAGKESRIQLGATPQKTPQHKIDP